MQKSLNGRCKTRRGPAQRSLGFNRTPDWLSEREHSQMNSSKVTICPQWLVGCSLSASCWSVAEEIPLLVYKDVAIRQRNRYPLEVELSGVELITDRDRHGCDLVFKFCRQKGQSACSFEPTRHALLALILKNYRRQTLCSTSWGYEAASTTNICSRSLLRRDRSLRPVRVKLCGYQ